MGPGFDQESKEGAFEISFQLEVTCKTPGR